MRGAMDAPRVLQRSVLVLMTLAGAGLARAQGEGGAAASPKPAPAASTATAARPASAGPCATPYAAVDTLLTWQQPGHTDRGRAAACLDLSREKEPSVGPERARQIKEILDARGLWVVMEKIPKDPATTDAAGRSRYVLFPKRQPEIYVERVGERWLWSAETVALAPRLYHQTFSLDLQALAARLPAWTRERVIGLEIWKIFGILTLIIIALLVRLLVVIVTTSQLRRLMVRLKITWGDRVLAQAARPLGILAAALCAAALLPALHLPVQLARVAVLAVRVLAAFSVVWLAYRIIDLLQGWLEAKAAGTETKMDDQLVPLVVSALKVFTVAIGVVFVLQNLDVDVGALLAGLGIGGLAFALAAQDTVKNLFGAVTIFLDRPFQVGDWVAIGGTEGVVESIGFRSVRIRAFTTALVSVPNAKIADAAIVNYGQRTYRRVKVTLGLTYDTTPEQMQAFVEGVRAILQASPHTRKDSYEVHFRDFGDFALEVFVYFFLDVPDWSTELRARHNIFLELLRLAKDLGVDFAFPTRTLHVERLARAGEAPRREVPEDLAAIVEGYGPGGDRARPEGPEITSGFLPS